MVLKFKPKLNSKFMLKGSKIINIKKGVKTAGINIMTMVKAI